MPYLADEERKIELSKQLLTVDPVTKGELNYVLCEIVQDYLGSMDPKEVGYADISEAGDAMIDAYLEFVRCVLVPYEERRRQENGDVWWINEVLT